MRHRVFTKRCKSGLTIPAEMILILPPAVLLWGMLLKHLLRAASWLVLAAILFVTVSPIELRPHTIITVNIDRAAAFAAVAMLFTLAYPRNWKTALFLLVVGAAGFEFLQLFSPTRHARVEDAVVKAVGAAFGTAVGRMIYWLDIQRSEKSLPSAAE